LDRIGLNRIGNVWIAQKRSAQARNVFSTELEIAATATATPKAAAAAAATPKAATMPVLMNESAIFLPALSANNVHFSYTRHKASPLSAQTKDKQNKSQNKHCFLTNSKTQFEFDKAMCAYR